MASWRRHNSPSLPPRAPEPVARTLKRRTTDEHLVRRLGSALVLQWDALPDELQDLIIDQAVLVEDISDDAAARSDIEGFIRTAKAVPLQSAPKTDAAAQ